MTMFLSHSLSFLCGKSVLYCDPRLSVLLRAECATSNAVLTMRGSSIASILSQALKGQRGWTPAWRNPEPKSRYDVVIVGGGGHGLGSQLDHSGCQMFGATHCSTTVRKQVPSGAQQTWTGGGGHGFGSQTTPSYHTPVGQAV